MVDVWVVLSAVLKKGVLRQTEKHDLQSSYIEFMVRLEASSRRELAEADEIDNNLKPYSMLTDKMERLYLCNGMFKPPEQFQFCAKCGHNLVDEPAKNKSTVRHNKRIQIQWEEDSRKVADFLQGKGEARMDKKGNPTTKVPNPKVLEEPLLCHCWQQFMSTVSGGYVCIFGYVNPITAQRYNEVNAPFSL
jgi:hypothetical protein